MVENSLDKITERLYSSRRKGTCGRKNERFENGCVPFQETKGGDGCDECGCEGDGTALRKQIARKNKAH